MSAPLANLERDAAFRNLVQHVRDYAIFLLDPEGNVVTWNDGAQRIKGYAAHEIIGKHFSQFFPAGDAAMQRPRDLLRAAARDGRYEEESWRVRKDGSRFWANVVITALYDADVGGQLIGYAKVTRDLTERRRTEEERIELLRQERTARAQAEAMLENLRSAHEQVSVAEAALRARNDFLSVAAHELKTPLTALKAAAQLLLRRAKQGKEPEPGTRAALEVVERQAHKLSFLVTNLLEVARIEGGRMSLEVKPTDLMALTKELVAVITATTGRAITVTGPPSLVAVVDPLRIEQVITNLLDNAVKFGPADRPIEVAVASGDRNLVRVSVYDPGPGVPLELRSQLFAQFFQGHTDRSGMGLGLYISKAIAERHGGTLGVTFPDSGGSAFEMTIPAGAGLAASGSDQA